MQAEQPAMGCYTPAPFCPDLRDFLAESRKQQTFYSNLEGSFTRRVLKTEEEADILREYIYNTMYSKRFTPFDRIVDSIQKRMISINKKYNPDGEIHFSVVWVHLFVYETKEAYCEPVFKIYKDKSTNDASFIDTNYRSYDCWDEYVESAGFPDSFVCVPRNGDYSFVDGRLDLLYLSSKKAPEDPDSHFSPCSIYSSFSHRVIRPWFDELKKLSREAMEKVKMLFSSMMAMVENFWNKNRVPIINVATFVISSLRNVVAANLSSPSDLFQPKTLGMMLLNITTDMRGFRPITPPSPSMGSELRGAVPKAVLEERDLLLEALQAPKRNWKKILKFFCSLFVKCRPVLMAALQTCGNGTVTAVVGFLLLIVEGIEKSGFLDSPEDVEMRTAEVIRQIGSTPGRPPVRGSAPEKGEDAQEKQEKDRINAKRQGIQEKRQEEAEGKQETQEKDRLNGKIQKEAEEIQKYCVPYPGGTPSTSSVAVQPPSVKGGLSLDAVLPIFSNLETESPNRIQKSVILCSISTAPTSHARTVVVKDVDGFRIYFITRATIPYLMPFACHLVGTTVTLRPCDNMVEVIDPEGVILGYLFFPKETIAIGLFPLDRIADGEAPEIKIIDDEEA